MNLRMEILAQERGTKTKLVKATGLTKMTIYRALSGRQCGKDTARAIAKAWGCPERWPELLDDTLGPAPVLPLGVSAIEPGQQDHERHDALPESA